MNSISCVSLILLHDEDGQPPHLPGLRVPGGDQQGVLPAQVTPDHRIKEGNPVSGLEETNRDVHRFVREEVYVEELYHLTNCDLVCSP